MKLGLTQQHLNVVILYEFYTAFHLSNFPFKLQICFLLVLRFCQNSISIVDSPRLGSKILFNFISNVDQKSAGAFGETTKFGCEIAVDPFWVWRFSFWVWNTDLSSLSCVGSIFIVWNCCCRKLPTWSSNLRQFT